MNKKLEQDLSRYLDGELPPERSDMLKHALAESDSLERAHADMREIGDLLRAQGVPDGKPAEVAWSDVQRAIRLAGADDPGPARILGSRLTWAAAIMSVGFVALGLAVLQSGVTRVAAAPVEVEWVDTEVPGATTMVYQDEETGLTVIWMMEEDTDTDGNVGT